MGFRRGVWTTNTEDMMRVNEQPNITYSLGWHDQSDWTHDEVRQFRGLNRQRHKSLAGIFGSMHRGTLSYDGKVGDLPSDVDWTLSDTEVVTYVKNQQCGDCWAFSAAGGLEGALAIAIGWTTSLSPQQFVDCSNAGTCGGGNEEAAMGWAKDNFACSLDSYPETGQDGSCNWNCEQVITAGSIWGTYDVTSRDEGALCLALTQRPITVAVAADDTFMDYKSGILDYQASGHINHAVLAVGYGYWDGTPFWKIKNSWGTNHGIDGYWLLARGNGKNQNYVLNEPAGVYVFGPYNPAMFLTNLQGMHIAAPTPQVVVA